MPPGLHPVTQGPSLWPPADPPDRQALPHPRAGSTGSYKGEPASECSEQWRNKKAQLGGSERAVISGEKASPFLKDRQDQTGSRKQSKPGAQDVEDRLQGSLRDNKRGGNGGQTEGQPLE